MQTYFDRRGTKLDTTLPSVRHIQDLIRNRCAVHIEMAGGFSMEGVIKWQDHEFIALRQDPSLPLALLNRSNVAVLRALG